MATFILVHGSFHGASCWKRLIPLLQDAGHRVLAPDLPGSGTDGTPLCEVNLERYVDSICEIVDAQAEPPILVAHSMGGIVCTQVAERRASAIKGLVYVCGLMLRSGETLTSFLEEFAHLGVTDLVLAHMVVREGGTIADFPTSAAQEVFYNRCTDEDAEWAASRLRPQATAVYGDAPAITEGRYGSVRRFYITGLEDRAVSLTYQRLMIERTPVERVFDLDTDHSPFLSAPKALAGTLATICGALAHSKEKTHGST